MRCKCNWLESILAIIILVFVWWPELVGMQASKWIVTIAAIVLLLHAILHRNLHYSMGDKMNGSAPKRKKRR